MDIMAICSVFSQDFFFTIWHLNQSSTESLWINKGQLSSGVNICIYVGVCDRSHARTVCNSGS